MERSVSCQVSLLRAFLMGGLRILAHLRKNLGEVEPLAMNVAVCDLYLGRSQPLNSNEREGLMQLRAENLLVDCVELIDHLLKTDRKVEQEAVEASNSQYEDPFSV